MMPATIPATGPGSVIVGLQKPATKQKAEISNGMSKAS